MIAEPPNGFRPQVARLYLHLPGRHLKTRQTRSNKLADTTISLLRPGTGAIPIASRLGKTWKETTCRWHRHRVVLSSLKSLEIQKMTSIAGKRENRPIRFIALSLASQIDPLILPPSKAPRLESDRPAPYLQNHFNQSPLALAKAGASCGGVVPNKETQQMPPEIPPNRHTHTHT